MEIEDSTLLEENEEKFYLDAGFFRSVSILHMRREEAEDGGIKKGKKENEIHRRRRKC